MKSRSSSPNPPSALPTAFTLVELLVTIAIIAILAALLFPVLSKVNLKAKETDAISRLRQVSVALIGYAAENNNAIPLGDAGKNPDGSGGRGLIWVNLLSPYFQQPDLRDNPIESWDAITSKYRKQPWVCPNLNYTQSGETRSELQIVKSSTVDPIGGIGYNINPLMPANWMTNAKGWGGTVETVYLHSLEFPTKRIAFASAYDWHLWGGSTAKWAFNRFGPSRAAAVYFDGHAAMVNKVSFQNGILDPTKN